MKHGYLFSLLLLGLVGCSSPGVQKIGDNLYSVSEKSQPTQAAAEHIPDPAIDDIKAAAKDYCAQDDLQLRSRSQLREGPLAGLEFSVQRGQKGAASNASLLSAP